VISGIRLNPFFGNAAADYARTVYLGNEVKDYEIFSEMHKKGILGFVTTKTLTSEEREGNPTPRFSWIERIQSMGLPNVSLYAYPFEKCDVPTIVSFVGKGRNQAEIMTKYVDKKARKNPNIIAVEYNLACPNVQGCPSCYDEHLFDPETNPLDQLKTVRKNTSLPVFAKIGYFPEEQRLIDFGIQIENAGVNGITAINSPPGMGVNIETRKTVTANRYGGVFGRGLKPLALRTVNILYRNTCLDIIGLGGIYGYSDAIEFLLAGAKAVEICSGFIDRIYPRDNETVIEEKFVKSQWSSFLSEFKKGTENYIGRKGIKSLSEIIGKLEKQ
jgi:dihydroorotate dehydrogenase (NAD+) catalytic subunit